MTFEDKMAFKDNQGKEYIIDFKLKKGESLDDAKKRLLTKIKFFWLHKDQSDTLVVGFKYPSGKEHKSDKMKLNGKSYEDAKSEFLKNLKFFWMHVIND
jgi:hypothetical protein